MNSTRYLLALIRAGVMLAWMPTAALAVVVTSQVQGPVIVLDWGLVAIAAAISTLTGGTTLAIRVNQRLMAEPDRPLVRPWMFAISHMLGSWVAGVSAFLGAMSREIGVWELLLGVLLASFLGAKFLEMAAEKWLPVVVPK